MTHIFMVNPFAGAKTFADDLRMKLSAIRELDYFVFNIRYAGNETALVKKIQHIFEGERLRFYCCGGSGTMRNMLNGFDDLSNVEIAFFPCGLTNDFLKMFGSEEERFHDINELIYGDVIQVDYIKSNHGVALNSLSTGLDSNCLIKMNDFRVLRMFGKEVPYTLATLYSIFVAKPKEYEVILDNGIEMGRFAEVFIGNGTTFGGNMCFAEQTVIDDGKGIFAIVGDRKGFRLLNVLLALIGRRFEKYPSLMNVGECSRIKIRRTDGSLFEINQDGDLINGVEVCEAEIVHKGLNFVVPKGVRL